MRAVQGGHFTVEYSEPAESQGRAWTRNASLSVVCESVERAVELLREHSPDAVIHVVRRISSGRTVLIDEPGPARLDGIVVDREFLVDVDSVGSLIVHRGLDEQSKADLNRLSMTARRAYADR